MNRTMNRILFVDDDPALLRSTARALRGFGWEVVPKTVPEATPTELLNVAAVLADWAPHGPKTVAMAEAAGLPVVIYTGETELVADYPVGSKTEPIETLHDALVGAIEAANHDPLCGLEGFYCPACADAEKFYQAAYDSAPEGATQEQVQAAADAMARSARNKSA